MKKTQLVLVAVMAIATLSFNSIYASGNKSANASNQELTGQIQRALNAAQFEDLFYSRSEVVNVVFTIDQNHDFKLVKIEGKNPELVKTSTAALSGKEILSSASMEPKTYSLPVRFYKN